MVQQTGNLRRSVLFGLTLAALGVCAARTVGFSVHKPMLGYANSYDMARIQVCFGVWPVWPGNEPPRTTLAQSHPSSPLRLFESGGFQLSDACYWSVDTVLARGGLGIHHVFQRWGLAGEEFDLRLLGLFRAVLLVGVVAGLAAVSWRISPVVSVLTAVSGALLLADPLNLLYLNTFYAEFSGILFTYAAVVLTVLLFMFPGSRANLVLWLLALLAVGLSKPQNLFVPLVCPAVLIPFFRAPTRDTLAIFFCVALLALVCFAFQNTNLGRAGTKPISMANATNTYLFTVLPEAGDPDRALQILGLPAHCREGLGKSWYSPEVSQHHPCPEVGDVSRLRLIALALLEPRSIFVPLLRSVPMSRPWLYTLGQVEGENSAPVTRHRLRMTHASLFDNLPQWAYVLLVSTEMIAGGLVGVFCLYRRFRNRAACPPLHFTLVLLSALIFATLTTSVFGDGYNDLEKHAILMQTLVPAELVLIIGAAIPFAWRDKGRLLGAAQRRETRAIASPGLR